MSSMCKFISIFVATLIATATYAFGSEFVLDPLTISIPAGFEGPVSQSQGKVSVTGFRKPRPGTDVATLLQISMYDFGPQLANIPKNELGNAAEKYLRELVAGVERRRTDFVLSPPARLQLAGIPVAKAKWTGKLNGLNTNGVMYCFLVGTRIISLHTQDTGSTPTNAMKEAMKAIESLRIITGG